MEETFATQSWPCSSGRRAPSTSTRLPPAHRRRWGRGRGRQPSGRTGDYPRKVVADALGHEVVRGRLVRVRRGTYGLGHDPQDDRHGGSGGGAATRSSVRRSSPRSSGRVRLACSRRACPRAAVRRRRSTRTRTRTRTRPWTSFRRDVERTRKRPAGRGWIGAAFARDVERTHTSSGRPSVCDVTMGRDARALAGIDHDGEVNGRLDRSRHMGRTAHVGRALWVTEDGRCRTFGATQYEFGCLDLGRGQQVDRTLHRLRRSRPSSGPRRFRATRPYPSRTASVCRVRSGMASVEAVFGHGHRGPGASSTWARTTAGSCTRRRPAAPHRVVGVEARQGPVVDR